MTNLFISQAIAQTTENSESNTNKADFSLTSFLPIILIFGIFYLFVVRPQNKKMKEVQAMLNSLKIGNKVITSSGIVGIICEIYEKENQVLLEIAENVRITILKQHITEVEKSNIEKSKIKQDSKSKSSKK